MPPSSSPRAKRPVEYSILTTATLCTLAVGAVMVYSASSAESLLQGEGGDPAMYLKRYVFLGLIGLFAMYWFSRNGLAAVKRLTPLLLAVAFALTIAVMLPGIGVTINGATRWLAAGPLQFQPSELLKVALVLYTARLLAERPASVKRIGTLFKPLLIVIGAACLLLLKQPDMGTAMVICFSIGCLLVAAGTPMRLLGSLVGGLFVMAACLAVVEPYRMERVTAFLDPFGDAGDTGFQAVQALTAIGSGGLFGVGLGESVQKIFYLPEAHTDMILAIIGEELGIVGMTGVAVLYGMIGYAGLRAAKAAADPYSKLVATGVTCLILSQATLNFFAVLGMAPLTGVPLPFISYGSTNLIVLLAGMGLVLNVAATGGLPLRKQPARPAAQRGSLARATKPRLRTIDGGRDADDRDRRGRDGGARGPGAGRRRRAAG